MVGQREILVAESGGMFAISSRVDLPSD